MVKEKVFKYEGEDSQRHQERSRPTMSSRIDRVTRGEKKGERERGRERGKLIMGDEEQSPEPVAKWLKKEKWGKRRGAQGQGEKCWEEPGLCNRCL